MKLEENKQKLQKDLENVKNQMVDYKLSKFIIILNTIFT